MVCQRISEQPMEWRYNKQNVLIFGFKSRFVKIKSRWIVITQYNINLKYNKKY